MVNTHHFIPTPGCIELNIYRRAGIVGSLVWFMFSETQTFRFKTHLQKPIHSILLPILEPLLALRLLRLHVKLHLHLFKFAAAENEIARRDLVPEGLTDLSDTEWNLNPGGVQDIL